MVKHETFFKRSRLGCQNQLTLTACLWRRVRTKLSVVPESGLVRRANAARAVDVGLHGSLSKFTWANNRQFVVRPAIIATPPGVNTNLDLHAQRTILLLVPTPHPSTAQKLEILRMVGLGSSNVLLQALLR